MTSMYESLVGSLFLFVTDPNMIFFLTIFYTMVIGFFGLAAYDLLSRLSR